MFGWLTKKMKMQRSKTNDKIFSHNLSSMAPLLTLEVAGIDTGRAPYNRFRIWDKGVSSSGLRVSVSLHRLPSLFRLETPQIGKLSHTQALSP